MKYIPDWLLSALLGLVFTIVISTIPFVQYMGWFFSSLCHEMGHTAYALYVGCPAFPAINLTGHAVTQRNEQILIITWLVLACLATLTVKGWRNGIMGYLFLAALVTYPLFAYVEPFKNVGHNLSGHVGEMIIAAIFLWRGLTGIATGGFADRILYCLCGWHLFFQNVYLCFGIAFVPSSLAHYRTSGSYGLVNDYLRLSNGPALPLIMVLCILLYTAAIALALFCARNER